MMGAPGTQRWIAAQKAARARARREALARAMRRFLIGVLVVLIVLAAAPYALAAPADSCAPVARSAYFGGGLLLGGLGGYLLGLPAGVCLGRMRRLQGMGRRNP